MRWVSFRWLVIVATLGSTVALAGEPPTLSWQRIWQGDAATNEYHQLVSLGGDQIFVAGDRGGPAEVNGTYLLAYDEAGNLLWDLAFVGNVQDHVSGLDTTIDGDVIWVSRVVLSEDFSEQIVVRKIAPNGSILWTSTFDLLTTNHLGHEPLLAIGPDGGPLVGYYDGGDFLLLRYAPDGQLVWSRSYDGDASDVDFMTDLVVADDNSAHFVGIADSYLTYLAVSVDAAGNEVWRRALSGPLGALEDAFLAQGPDGRIVVTGNPESACGSQEQRSWKLDHDGSVLWEDVVPNDPCDVAIAIDIDIDEAGDAILVGNLSETPPNIQIVVRKLDGNDGSLIWRSDFDGPGFNSLAETLERDSEGGIYVTGWEVIGAQDRDVATVKFDADGNEEWFQIWSGDAGTNDIVAALAVDDAFAIHLAGVTFDPVSFEDGFLVRYGFDDPASVPSVPDLTSVGSTQFGPSVRVLPNPSSGEVSFELVGLEGSGVGSVSEPEDGLHHGLSRSNDVTLEVLTAEGRRVATVVVPAGLQTVSWQPAHEDGSHLADGVYFLRCRSAGGADRAVPSRIPMVRIGGR